MNHYARTALIGLGLGLIEMAAAAQEPPRPQIQLGSVSIQTTGGISYFTFSAGLPPCEELMSEMTRTGTNIVVRVGLVPVWDCYTVPCYDCPFPLSTNTTALVLGRLPAGGYRLTLLAYTPDYFGTFTLHAATFTVPEWSGPTLVAVKGGSTLQVQINGVPIARYLLETSTNLVNWRPVNVISNTYFTITTNVSTLPIQFGYSRPRQFIRAAVQSGSVTAP